MRIVISKNLFYFLLKSDNNMLANTIAIHFENVKNGSELRFGENLFYFLFQEFLPRPGSECGLPLPWWGSIWNSSSWSFLILFHSVSETNLNFSSCSSCSGIGDAAFQRSQFLSKQTQCRLLRKRRKMFKVGMRRKKPGKSRVGGGR